MTNKQIAVDFAPMEGVTDAVFRRVHHQYYGGIDRYYMPFLSPTQDHLLTERELRELSPENNRGLHVIPQLLTKNADDFLWAATELSRMGYREVNLNLGCPSGTVVAKGKGSGMLADTDALERFLDAVFSHTPIPVSVKTRIGRWDPQEAEGIFEVYRQYPISELIVHPRTAKEGYRGELHPEFYTLACKLCPFPVTYNGDLKSEADVRRFTDEHPDAQRVMIGRGLCTDPMLAERILKTAPDPNCCRDTFIRFHNALVEAYSERFASGYQVLSRMKELWNYFILQYEDQDGKYRKRIGKARSLDELLAAVSMVFHDLPTRM